MNERNKVRLEELQTLQDNLDIELSTRANSGTRHKFTEMTDAELADWRAWVVNRIEQLSD